jgi:hypothetical protein
LDKSFRFPGLQRRHEEFLPALVRSKNASNFKQIYFRQAQFGVAGACAVKPFVVACVLCVAPSDHE